MCLVEGVLDLKIEIKDSYTFLGVKFDIQDCGRKRKAV